MGLFDEIKKALDEAMEEARRQGQPVAGTPDDDDTAARTERIRAKQAARAEAQEAAQAAAAQAAAQAEQAARSAAAEAAAKRLAIVRQPTGAERLRRLLRQQATVRDAMVLSTLLARPASRLRR